MNQIVGFAGLNDFTQKCQNLAGLRRKTCTLTSKYRKNNESRPAMIYCYTSDDKTIDNTPIWRHFSRANNGERCVFGSIYGTVFAL